MIGYFKFNKYLQERNKLYPVLLLTLTLTQDKKLLRVLIAADHVPHPGHTEDGVVIHHHQPVMMWILLKKMLGLVQLSLESSL
jgi:hypothetical protein